MRKRPVILGLAVVAISILAVTLSGWLGPRELYHRGRSLKAWVLQYSNGPAPQQREEAATALREVGPKAVPGLVRLLRSRDPLGRRLAWRLMRELPAGWRRAVSPHLKMPDAYLTREAAARALPLFGTQARSALPALLAALRDSEGQVAWLSAEALAQIGGRGVVPALIAAMGGRNSAVRQVAAYALGKIGPEAEAAVPALAQALKDNRARSMAIFGLCRMGISAAPAMLEACERASGAEKAAAARVLGGMLQAISASNLSPAVPAGPVEDGGTRGASNIISTLIGALRDPVCEVRIEAAQALSAGGPRAAPAVPALTECLSDPTPALRAMAAKALEAVGPEARTALPELLRLEADQDPSVRSAAREALRKVSR